MRLAISWLLWLALLVPVAAQEPATYIRAGRLIDTEAGVVLSDQLIVVRGERVISVEPYSSAPPLHQVWVDWSDRTVLPGLIDLHTHLADVEQSRDVALPMKTSPAATALLGAKHALVTLNAGFTTVRDVGTYRGLTDVALRDAIEARTVPGPRMLVAGAYLTIPGGGGEVNLEGVEVPADMRLGVGRTPQELASKADALLEAGADFCKLIVTGAVLAVGTEVESVELSDAAIRELVETAERHHTYCTAHAHGARGIKSAILNGVRSIEHASLIDDEGIALAKERGVWLVMDIYNGDYIDEMGSREGWPEEYLRKNRETTQRQREGFRKAVRAGVHIGFGTDAGVFPHGLNARQFAYMVKWGMTPMQAIQSATVEAARLIGWQEHLGRIAPGYYADMIAVEGDPIANIRVLEAPPIVMQGGVIVSQP